MNNTIKEQISAYYDIWISTNSIYDKWAKKHNISSNSLFTLWVIYNAPENCSIVASKFETEKGVFLVEF